MSVEFCLVIGLGFETSKIRVQKHLGAIYMSRASPANQANQDDSILSRLMVA